MVLLLKQTISSFIHAIPHFPDQLIYSIRILRALPALFCSQECIRASK